MRTTRYANNAGHSIAYQLAGETGPALLFVPGFVSNLEMQWEHAPIARFLDGLASGTRLALFDRRGTGMSERTLSPISLAESAEDMKAVLDHAGIQKTHVFAVSEGGPLAANFAATYPERIESLVLYGTFPNRALGTAERARSLAADVADLWGTGRVLQHLAPSWNDDASGAFLARYERQSATPACASRLVVHAAELDVTSRLANVKAPSLVLHRSNDPIIRAERGRALAAALPNGRFVELEGRDHLVYSGDDRSVLDHVHGFVGSSGTPTADRLFAAVAFVDIVQSTERATRLGDSAWRDLLHAFHATVHRTIARFGGDRVNTLGDGVLSAFSTATAAVRWSREIHNEASQLGLVVRIGIHASEVERRGSDLAGIGVHVAARVAGVALAGRSIVTCTVRDLLEGSMIELIDRGNHDLVGIARPWRLFEVPAVGTNARQQDGRECHHRANSPTPTPQTHVHGFGSRMRGRVEQRH